MTKAYAFGGNTMTVLVPGAETGGAFAVLHVVKPAGSSTPPHSHDQETEVSYVLSGALGVETEGRSTILGPGELRVLPPKRPHRLFNDSDAAAREFLLCVPAWFDRFVAAAGSEVPPYAEPRAMTDADRQRLVEAAPAFGVRLLRSAEPVQPAPPPAIREPERWDALGARVEVLAWLGGGDDDLVLLRESVAPGWTVPLHGHADPECVFVISGTLDLYRDGPGGGWLRLDPDEAGYVAPNVRHAIRNAGSASADLLTVTTVRMSRFFATIGSPAIGDTPRPASPAEMAAVPGHVADYGYWLGSREENAAIGLAWNG
ncbi:cupin domain-containing protein [Inquilinus limosus]|uniref:cupin domain-containing protein n=1 Tax=Inquilinus limosus TaxID=171674 RepID=UPI003F5CDC46